MPKLSYLPNGFLATVANTVAVEIQKSKPKKETITVELKEPKQLRQSPNKQKPTVQSFSGNPYVRQAGQESGLARLFSTMKGLGRYNENKNRDNTANYRNKDISEKEKQSGLLDEIAKNTKGGGGNTTNFLGGGLPGGKLIKKLFKGVLASVALVTAAFSDGFKSAREALGTEFERLASTKGVGVDSLGISSKIRGAVNIIGDWVVSGINSFANELGVQGDLIPANLISGATAKISTQIDTWANNLIDNTDTFGADVVGLFTKTNEMLGRATSGIRDTVGLIGKMKSPLENALQSAENGIKGALDSLDELQDYFRKQGAEEKDFRKKLAKYRDLKKEYSNETLTTKQEKELSALREEVGKSAQKALDSGMNKSSGIYNDAKALTDPVQKIVLLAKEEQERYANMTTGTMKNGSIFGVGGNTEQEIARQEKIRNQRFIDMYEAKKKHGSLTKHEVDDYNKLKENIANARQKKANSRINKNTIEKDELTAEVKRLESLKKEAEAGDLLAKAKVGFLYSSEEAFKGEIEKKKQQIKLHDSILKELEAILRDAKEITVSKETYRAPTYSVGKAIGSGTKGLLETIAHGEGTSDAKARKKGYSSGYDVTLGYGRYADDKSKPITSMTIGEIKKHQSKMLKGGAPSTAVGKYQVLKKTLIGMQKKLGLSDSTLYDAKTQDAIGEELLKGRGYDKFKNGKINRDEFQLRLSKEWASIAKDEGNISYYKQHVGTSNSTIDRALGNIKNAKPTSTKLPQSNPQPQKTEDKSKEEKQTPPLPKRKNSAGDKDTLVGKKQDPLLKELQKQTKILGDGKKSPIQVTNKSTGKEVSV